MYRIDKHGLTSKNVANRIADLARLGQVVFHAGDLANLWHIRNQSTLHTTLHRYAQKGVIFRIYKGMYALKPVDELDPLLLGLKALHRFGYVSTETVLTAHGIIQQKIAAITLVSDISKQFSIGTRRYRCRKLTDRYLYNPAGIITRSGILTATAERAIADLLYFNPRAYFDGAGRIDWNAVRALQQKIGYPLTPTYYAVAKPKRRRA